MPLESGTYISDLVVTNPVGNTDFKSEGDNHLRLIKSVILNTFPSITGAMNATQAELNSLAGRQSFIDTFLQAATVADARAAIAALEFPAGTKLLFHGTAPTGWAAVAGAAYNDAMLRVVNTGTPSTAGTNGFLSLFSLAFSTNEHTLTAAESGLPDHTHLTNGATHFITRGGTGLDIPPGNTSNQQATTGSVNGGAQDAAEGHSHVVALTAKYVDFLIAEKT